MGLLPLAQASEQSRAGRKMKGWLNRVLGVAIGGAAAVILSHGRTPRAEYPLLAENHGALRTVEVQFNAGARATLRPLGAFLLQMEAGTAVVGVCSDAKSAEAFQGFARVHGAGNVRTVVVHAPITAWAKDRFLVSGSNPALLLQPRSSVTGLEARTNDALVAPALAKAMPERFRARELRWRFDAGDILATRTHVFVSDVLLKKNAGISEAARHAMAADLRQAFGREVVWLRNAPEHHIGMFLAPLDDGAVAVGDPGIGRGLWTRADTGRLGKPEFGPRLSRSFLAVADQLRRAGFRVVPVPAAPFAPQVFVSYTNGVFETRGPSKIVYMPVYGSPALDTAARIAYEREGWQVRPIPVEGVFRYRGTIGCLVNVLERGP